VLLVRFRPGKKNGLHTFFYTQCEQAGKALEERLFETRNKQPPQATTIAISGRFKAWNEQYKQRFKRSECK